MTILNPVLEARFRKLLYRIRFLGLYIIFGLLSILLEFFIRSYLINMNFNPNFSTVFAIWVGVLFAYFSNVKFNFKIPKARRNRALSYFIIISFFSAILQLSLKKLFLLNYFSYELNRLFISGTVFIIAYVFHLKYSFRDYKKVGVAIYANGVENLNNIHSRIGQYSDFIHVDIVDKTMCKNAEDVKTYRLETMKAYWPDTQIQTHIMSKQPSEWVDQVLSHSDVIYVHAECEEDISEIFEKIRSNGKKPGLALTISTNPDDVIQYLKKSSYVLLLTISNPGNSGQKFDIEGLERIKQLNNLSFRKQFTLCIDGGVNENIVNILDAENIVSGSSVLKNKDPKWQIMRLQTRGRYGAV